MRHRGSARGSAATGQAPGAPYAASADRRCKVSGWFAQIALAAGVMAARTPSRSRWPRECAREH
jgi:hypothetical protein